MSKVISEKTLCTKDFIPFLSFRRDQKQESNVQQVGGLVTRNISVFLLLASRALLQRYTEFNRLLLNNFLTYYSCSYYSSMISVTHICSERLCSIFISKLYFLLCLPTIYRQPHQFWHIFDASTYFKLLSSQPPPRLRILYGLSTPFNIRPSFN